MRKKRILCMICAMLSFLTCIMIFLPWMEFDGRVCTIAGFYREALWGKGLAAIDPGDGSAYVCAVSLAFPVLVGVLSGVKGILLLGRRRAVLTGKVVYGAEFLYVAAYASFFGYEPQIPALASGLAVFLEFMIQRYLDSYQELDASWKEARKREQEEKAERKQRLDFPGRYDPLLGKILRGYLLHQRKPVTILCVGNSVLLGALFVLLALRDRLTEIYSVTVYLPVQGLNGILRNALVTVIVLYAFFETMAFYCYMKNQTERERLLWMLGAREQLRTRARIEEYGLLMFMPLLPGLSVGIVWYLLLCRALGGYLSLAIPPKFSPGLCAGAVAAYLGISFCMLMILDRIFESRRQGERRQKDSSDGLRKWGLPAVTAAGAGLFLYGILGYSRRRNGESLYLLLAAAAGMLLLLCVQRVRKCHRKAADSGSFRQLWDKISLQQGIFADAGIRGAAFLFHFLFLAAFAFPLAAKLAAPAAEELYPYDYVCMAYPEDEEIFDGIRADGLAEVSSYPMARVTAVQGGPTQWYDFEWYRKVIWPQGQHAAISESTYRKLCEAVGETPAELSLQEDEIYVVYQEDSSVDAHPLDWYMSRRTPYLRIGKPLEMYETAHRERYYPPRTLAGEERRILTGVLGGGSQEDLVVFSDTYFEELEPENGPVRMYLIRAAKENYQEVGERLQEVAEGHAEDSYLDHQIQTVYARRDKIRDTRSERALSETALLLEMLLLMLCTALLLDMKAEFERAEQQKKYRMLFVLGAQKEQCVRALRREIRSFYMPPLLWACGAAAVTGWLTGRLRMMTRGELAGTVLPLLLLWLLYLLLQVLWFRRLCGKAIRACGLEDT